MFLANQPELNDALLKALTRATTDQAFRARLLKAPAAAIAEITGKDVLKGLKLHFREKGGHELTINLPPFSPAGTSLSEKQLEEVAGGCSIHLTGNCLKSCCGTL